MDAPTIPTVAPENIPVGRQPISQSNDTATGDSKFDRVLIKASADVSPQGKSDDAAPEDEKSDSVDSKKSPMDTLALDLLLSYGISQLSNSTNPTDGQVHVGQETADVLTIGSVQASNSDENSSQIAQVPMLSSVIQSSLPTTSNNLEEVAQAVELLQSNDQTGSNEFQESLLKARNVVSGASLEIGTSAQTGQPIIGQLPDQVQSILVNSFGLHQQSALIQDGTSVEKGPLSKTEVNSTGMASTNHPSAKFAALPDSYQSTIHVRSEVAEEAGKNGGDSQPMPRPNTIGQDNFVLPTADKKVVGVSLGDSVVQQIGSKLSSLSFPNRKEIRVELEPESLGKVNVSIVQEKDGIVSVRMLADNQLAKDLIESRLQDLKAAFERQGLQVGGFSVDLGQNSSFLGSQPSFDLSQRNFLPRSPVPGLGSPAFEEDNNPAFVAGSQVARGVIDLRV